MTPGEKKRKRALQSKNAVEEVTEKAALGKMKAHRRRVKKRGKHESKASKLYAENGGPFKYTGRCCSTSYIDSH
jgi:hypothetical protein